MKMLFDEAYAKLNKTQKLAVDTIDGPVMVVAGPGTGKTQILTLRIANILKKTDTGADGILCLTFTNSGVHAMRKRLRMYVGSGSSKITISTFHSFAMKMVEEFYISLGYLEKPQLADEISSVALCDEVLESHDFQYLRSRTNKALYFREIKSLVSLLKRERLSPDDFLAEIKKEINFIETDETSISSRGPSKGQLKQEAVKKIDSLKRTEEIVKFYELYDARKRQKNLLDYDDVLAELVRLVGESEDACATMRERYLYVLVDEHQDSSGVQNEFLSRVWGLGKVEKPNVFVVGDDRQLIYGFGGASLSHFEGFKKMFEDVVVITLTDNYRSTQKILDTADLLMANAKVRTPLLSHRTESDALRIVEATYPRDEILRAGLEMKDFIANGGNASECAILVPKNNQVKNAIRVLRGLGLPVSGKDAQKLFEVPETQSVLAILRALASPEAPHLVVPILLDPLSQIPPLVAHKFLVAHDSRKLTLSKLLEEKKTLELYPEDDKVQAFAEKLSSWLTLSSGHDVYGLVQKIGDEWLVATAADHEALVRRIEVVRSLLHLVLSQTEKNPKMSLGQFLEFIERLEEYSTDVPLATLGGDDGVQVLTLHKSKGLEFDFVWIAHLDEKNLLGRNGGAFTLPESVKSRIEEKDEETIRRELYVAMTRARRFCVLSYSTNSYTGGVQELSPIILSLGENAFAHSSAVETEKFIEDKDVSLFVRSEESLRDPVTIQKLKELVREEYIKHKVSVTHLNNFFECPWKWYFRNLLQLPEPKTISLEFGNLVHGILEDLLKGKLTSTEKTLASAIDVELEKVRGLDEAEIARMKKDALSVITRWTKDRLPDILESHTSEKNLSCYDPDFEHLQITGKIDLTEDLGDGAVRVTDFKTGTVKKKNEIEKNSLEGRMSDYRRQLTMYSYLINNTSRGNTHVATSRLEFLEAKEGDKDAIYSTEINADDLASLHKDISDFDQYIISGEWVDLPCNFKPFKGGGECEYCKLAEMYRKS